VTLKSFGDACNAELKPKLAYLAASVFIAAAVVGLLSLTSCAHTEDGLARETQLYLTTSNATHQLRQVVPYVPPPANNILEGCLAVGGALLALWATHLHRSLNDVRNGKSAPPAPASPPPPQTG
jgi:hypothetical protein